MARGCQYLDDVFLILVFGNAANVRCSVLNRRECGRAWRYCSGLVVAILAVCNGSRYTPEAISVWTILLLCIAACGYVCSGVHMLYNSQVPRGRPSLLYDHTNVILMMVVKEGFYCIYCTTEIHQQSRNRWLQFYIKDITSKICHNLRIFQRIINMERV